jgi:hypothetical protein
MIDAVGGSIEPSALMKIVPGDQGALTRWVPDMNVKVTINSIASMIAELGLFSISPPSFQRSEMSLFIN